MNKGKLNILWTTGDVITSEKMVLMYAINSKSHNWWQEIDIIIWGASAQLISQNEMLQEKIKMAMHKGIKVYACKGCTDQLGVSEILTQIGVDVKYYGEELTEILQGDEKLLTI